MFKKITTLLLFFCLIQSGNSQELQFNQWQFAPALLNPSLTGAYEGSFRVGGIIKDKWGSVDSRSWKTLEAYVDAPIIRGFRKSDWIAVGIAYDVDQAGSLKFNQQYQRASLAYHLGWGKKFKSAFTIGGQFTNVATKVGFEGNRTEESLRTATSAMPNGTNGVLMAFFANAQEGNLESSYNSWTASVGYRSQMNKKNSIGMGFSLSQFITDNNQGLDLKDELPARYTAFFNFRSQTSKKTSFEPQVVFTKQGVNSKLYLQGILGYDMKNGYTLKYGAGINTLNNDFNIPLYAGIEKGSLKVGLAYDVNLSEIGATATYGGLEVAASYIHILAKKPEPKPIIICPRL